jgi:hypothetical protein
LEPSPRKSVTQVAQQMMFLSSAQTATKMLHLHTQAYKTTVVYTLYDADHGARWKFVNWYLHGTLTAETHPKIILFSGET